MAHDPNLVVEALNDYLGSTRLSMDQIAKRWKVSTAMLSQIKNGKKRAGIDLGLKILRENGTDIESRYSWLEGRKMESSEEYHLVKQELRQVKVRKNLQEDFSKLLENEPILLDIFLDVAIAESAGVTWNSIFKNYGEYGVDLANSLKESGMVDFSDSKYTIRLENTKFITNEITSFGLVKALIEMQKTRKKRGTFKGELQYNVTDITEEAFEELIQLNKDYVKNVRYIMDNNEKHRLAGGIRVISQSLVALAKGALCLVLLLSFNLINPAQAGGIEGGSSSGKLGGIEGGSSDIIRAMRKPRDFTGSFGKKFTYKKGTLRVFHAFEHKETAIEEMVKLNKDMVDGNYDTKILRKISTLSSDGCKGNYAHMLTARKPNKRAMVKPIGFNIKETFNAMGEPRFSIIADYYVPCEK